MADGLVHSHLLPIHICYYRDEVVTTDRDLVVSWMLAGDPHAGRTQVIQVFFKYRLDSSMGYSCANQA
jgi:hypothetical protein